jgi:hypothetical protein
MLAEPGTIVLFGGFVFFLAFLLTLIGAVIFLIVHLSRRKKVKARPHGPLLSPKTSRANVRNAARN